MTDWLWNRVYQPSGCTRGSEPLTQSIEPCPITGYRWKSGNTCPPKSTRLLALFYAQARGTTITEDGAAKLIFDNCRDMRVSVEHELATLHHHGCLVHGEKLDGKQTYQVGDKKNAWVLLEPYLDKIGEPALA